MDRIGNRRATDDDSSPGPNNYSKADDEVNKLIKENYRTGNIPSSVIQELRRRYNDDKLIDVIQDKYYEKIGAIRKRAMKFTKLIEKKYGSMGYPLHIVLNKALKYKKKYNLSEPEFEIFRQTYQRNLNTRNKGKLEVIVPNTTMAKVFGDPNENSQLVTVEGEHKVVKQIIELYNAHRPLHAQVVTQSLSYDGINVLTPQILNNYDSKVHNAASFVHPVIAAMFLPKIKKFDEYFLYSNLAYIVKAKQDKESLVTYHNYIMLYNLVTEPTDVVCSGDSPLVDIQNRVTLQFNLWKNVLRLRNAQFYDTAGSPFAADLMNVVDQCRINNYDAPDLIMVGDESVILRRLINAFAFRSVVVVSSPIVNYSGPNNVNLPIVATRVIKVPMINIRLPQFDLTQMPNIAARLGAVPNPLMGNPLNNQNIQDHLYNFDFIYNNGRFEPHVQTVIYADGVVIFNVPRRTYHPLMNAQSMFEPTNFANMPKHIYGMEKLNQTSLDLNNNNIDVGSSRFYLRSAIVLKTQQQQAQAGQPQNEFIIGSKTFLYTDPALPVGAVPAIALNVNLQKVYDPYIYNYGNNAPNIQPLRNPIANEADEANNHGVIFFFVKPDQP